MVVVRPVPVIPMSVFHSHDPFLSAVEAGLPRRAWWQAPAVIGVSGGADSTALVLALVALAPSPEATAGLVVAHAEHDVRTEAAADRDVVVALAGRLGLRCVTRRVEVRGPGHPRGEGLEARARRLRYRFFEEVAYGTGSRHVAVAHTADDQAETILHRILRGTGPAGVAGMVAARQLCEGVAIIRPLLAIRRQQVRDWLLANGQRWCEDATNRDIRHARNFLRHEIISRCVEGPYPAAAEAIGRLGEQTAKLSTALASAAEYLLDRHVTRLPDGALVIDAAPLATLDHHLVAEVMASLWRREGWPRRDMTARHYERLVDMLRAVAAESESPRAELPGGIAVTAADRRRLVVARQPIPYDVISTRL
jgi:tRNA(Ile)-lysidine synthase